MQTNYQSELKKLFKIAARNYSLVGIAVNPFNRLGLEDYCPNYRIASLRYPMESVYIEKKIKLLSLEKNIIPHHLNLPRNSASVITHPATSRWLSSLPHQPLLIPYYTSPRIDAAALTHQWRVAANHWSFGKKLFENKSQFRAILKKLNLPFVPGEQIDSLKTLIAKKKVYLNRYGPVSVIQHPTRGGGRGTFFIRNEKDWREMTEMLAEEPPTSLIISHFIEGPSPSATGCVLPHGIVSTNLQLQILDAPVCYNFKTKKGNGRFCGHDWTNSALLPPQAQQQAHLIMERVGVYLAAKGYRGIFGIDFVLDKNDQTLYPVELNARLLGSFPTLTMVQQLNNEAPIFALHSLSFLDDNINKLLGELNLEALNSIMRRNKQGGQLILHNKEGSFCRNKAELKPGVYILKRNNLKFVREGYKLNDLYSEKEFLITDGVPWKGSAFSPNRRLCRIITLSNLLDGTEANKLTPWAEQIAKRVYRAFQLEPVRFFKLKRFLNPSFMLKA